MKDTFRKISERITEIVGSVYALLIAVTIIFVWAITGPIFHFSDTWQLVINTGTTIVTFLMVFVIQNSQNRESRATQIKLDELILSIEKAHNQVAGIESAPDEKMAEIEEEILESKDQSTVAEEPEHESDRP